MSIQEYQDIIDGLVELSRRSVSNARIQASGHAERTNDADLPLSKQEQHRKTALLSLDDAQMATVLELLGIERARAVHDVLSLLEDIIQGGDLKACLKSGEIFESPYATLHYDFVCRSEGDAWPEDD